MERDRIIAVLVVVLLVGFSAVAFGTGLDFNGEEAEAEPMESNPERNLSTATFAGGCFWCTEAVYEDVGGVEKAISGYAGGKKSTASYDQVKTGETGHREAVRVVYNSSVVSYSRLLELYWRSIDPTDAGGQFTDRGYQYTTAIYTHNGRQYRLAVESRKNISRKFEEPVVTEVRNYSTFFRAEDHHQNYSKKRTVSYELYKQGSGRKGFLGKIWENHPLQ